MVSVKKNGDMQNNMWLSKDTSAFCYFTLYNFISHFSKKVYFPGNVIIYLYFIVQ